MFRRLLLLFVVIVAMAALESNIAQADDTDIDADYPWRFHAAPFAFTFGNQIDSHQQSRIIGDGRLQGFLYIHDTGQTTEAGLPIAERAKCPHMTCRVGWNVVGVPIRATLVHKGPRIWLVNPSDLPTEPGYRHFQWLGPPHSPHDLVIGQQYDGMLLKRVAPAPFFWLGGSGGSGGGGDPGGCGGGTTGGCEETDHTDEGGCSGGGGEARGYGEPGGQGAGGHTGRVVPEGIDPHTNIVTVWDGTWSGGGGCDGHDGGGGCDGHDGGGSCDGGTDTGGCPDSDGGGCAGG